MKTLVRKSNHIKAAVTRLRTGLWARTQTVKSVLSNERADFYISDGVKVIIAVVLGALLLAAMTLIFKDTIIPRITKEITDLFG